MSRRSSLMPPGLYKPSAQDARRPRFSFSLHLSKSRRAGNPREPSPGPGDASGAATGVGRGVDERDIDPRPTPVNSNRKEISDPPSHPAPHPRRRGGTSSRSRKRPRRRGRSPGTPRGGPSSARLLPEEPAGRVDHCRSPPRGSWKAPNTLAGRFGRNPSAQRLPVLGRSTPAGSKALASGWGAINDPPRIASAIVGTATRPRDAAPPPARGRDGQRRRGDERRPEGRVRSS